MTLASPAENRLRRCAANPGDIESTCYFIQALVASVFGIEVAELRAKHRGRAPVAFARQAAMYLAHVNLGLSHAAVGAHFDRDRTTVAYACARIEDGRDQPRWAGVFDLLEVAVQTWARALPTRGWNP